LRTRPVIVIADLGNATVGVTLVKEMLRGGVGATREALVFEVARAAAAVAAGTGERTGSEIASIDTASRTAEAVRRHTRSGMVRELTSRLPVAPTRPGLSAPHWGR